MSYTCNECKAKKEIERDGKYTIAYTTPGNLMRGAFMVICYECMRDIVGPYLWRKTTQKSVENEKIVEAGLKALNRT